MSKETFPVEPPTEPKEVPYREVGYTEGRSYFDIEHQHTSGEKEVWESWGDYGPMALDTNAGNQVLPKETWQAYVAYLNARGPGNFRLARITTFTRTEVL